ncbi:type 2 periplasmic-binding domain-containing protein [Rugamonas aquatica]|uniref:Solute-binding protein family 3/N-terminal domain-containing protein n=1 Tax=Rugamonas aquatica TaxID=2743357 RepID=A0A6A7MWB7_9BURK|nr:hypothetical protein [Rugamonas aquatica]MQA36999.1 hypothetical protein [Rugamonas aquatica]
MLLAGLAAGQAEAGGETARIVMASILEQNNSYAARWLRLIYTEAFQQLGVELEIRSFPAARASVEAIAGNIDGELTRAYEYGDLQSVLMRVPEAPLSSTTAAYARTPTLHLDNGWESLRGSSYRVEYRFGYLVVQQRLAEVLPQGGYTAVHSSEMGLRKLSIGRTDVYIDNVEVVDSLLESAEFRHSGIHQAGTLERKPVYAYLNKKHEKLALRLSAVLKKMRDSGEVERLRLQALKE